MIQSAGVLIAALIIYFFQDTHPGVRIVDPICTFGFACVVLCTTVPVSRDCFLVLLEKNEGNEGLGKIIYQKDDYLINSLSTDSSENISICSLIFS